MQTASVPEWKFQRQFNYVEGVSTARKRPSVFADDPVKLLSAEQITSFLANGCLVLNTDLPPDFHQAMFERFSQLIGADNDHNPGNNLLPVVPELNRVFEDGVVRGALTSILGPNYMMHPHRVLHDNPPGSDAQVWHHDSYWGYKRKVHNHRPWWVMIMYYPQNIYEEIGPTGVIPGSQCIAQRLDGIDQLGRAASGPTGTCMLIHYDIWHRKMKNLTNLKRFMVKFEFTRMAPPQAGEFHLDATPWQRPADAPAYDIEPMWREQWNWLAGRKPERFAHSLDGELQPLLAKLESKAAAERGAVARSLAKAGAGARAALPALIARLNDPSEPVGLNAAYALAAIGKDAVPELVRAMLDNDGENVDDARVFIDEGQHSEVEMVARNAAHGLAAIGADAVPALLGCLDRAGPRVRKYAVFALGESGADGPDVVAALIRSTKDADPYVRINAVEALGLKHATPEAVRALAAALSDADDEVRFNAALALARVGPDAASAVPALRESLADGNRYVVGYAVEALERIGTPEALAALVPFLKLARYCPLTSINSLF
ncbi:MAG TPA: HEAT repeat domain-containing protein [Magnetospirillaceae bacterium]|jgi:HEAT repeat protein